MKKIFFIAAIVVSVSGFSQAINNAGKADTTTDLSKSRFMTVGDFYKFFYKVFSDTAAMGALQRAYDAKLNKTSADSLVGTMNIRIDSIKVKGLFTQIATQTIATTTTKTSIVGTGIGSLTIPANTLTVGKTYRMHIEGMYSTPLLLNLATVTCRMELNGTAITTASTSSLASLLASANNSAFQADQIITIRTTGSSGTLVAFGQLTFTTSTTARGYIDMNTGVNPVAINTTISNTFTPTIQLGNSNSGNTISSFVCTFEALN